MLSRATRESVERAGYGPEYVEHGTATTATVTARAGQSISPTRGYGAYSADAELVRGTMVPSAYFRRVEGLVVNPDGEPIEAATWLIAQGGLPTAGRVDDQGRFAINLLRADYNEFALLVRAEHHKGLDYVWYEYVDHHLETYIDEVTLVFKEGEITNGVDASIGVTLG